MIEEENMAKKPNNTAYMEKAISNPAEAATILSEGIADYEARVHAIASEVPVCDIQLFYQALMNESAKVAVSAVASVG